MIEKLLETLRMWAIDSLQRYGSDRIEDEFLPEEDLIETIQNTPTNENVDLVSDGWFTADVQRLQHVEGNLFIRFNKSLENLDFLCQLKTVGGDMVIFGNPSLSDVTGLKNLESVGGHLVIIGNNALTDLTALNEELQIGGNLKVVGNPLQRYGPLLKYEPGGEAQVVVDTLQEFVVPPVMGLN